MRADFTNDEYTRQVPDSVEAQNSNLYDFRKSVLEAIMRQEKSNAFQLVIVTLALISTSVIAKASDGAYRGSIVCEKLKISQFMLRAPLDIITSGKTAVAARPIFNLAGTRVVGSEIATGTVADNGTIKLTSKWKSGGSNYEGNYSGVLNEKGGTLTGTQSWTMPQGQQTRTCMAAVIQTESDQ